MAKKFEFIWHVCQKSEPFQILISYNVYFSNFEINGWVRQCFVQYFIGNLKSLVQFFIHITAKR